MEMRTGIAFAVPAIAGLGAFALIALPGDGLSWMRFSLAALADIAVSWSGARILTQVTR